MDRWRSKTYVVGTLMLFLILAVGCIAPPSGAPVTAAEAEIDTESAPADENESDEAGESEEADEAEAGTSTGELPPGPTLVSRHEMEIDDGEADFTVVQRVLAFEPDTWAPPHYHGGHVMVTILDGEFTNRMGDQLDDVTVLRAGDNLQEPPGQAHSPGNATDEMLHVFASFAMPADAAITTVVEGMVEGDLPPGPSQLYVGTMDVTDVTDEFTFIQVVFDFPPGAWTPNHFHGGNGLTTVIAGEMTRRINGVEETYGVGESWYEIADEVHAAGNATDAESRIIVTFVLPEGAELTTAVD